MSTAPQKVKTILNSNKLRLSAPNPESKGSYAKLMFDLYQNNPRIVVDTGDQSMRTPDKNYGRITAALDPVVFSMLIELLKKAVQNKEPFKVKVSNSNYPFVDGRRSKELEELSDIWVGRDKEGCIFISLIAKQGAWPKIQFIFGPADARFHSFIHDTGEKFTRAELSELGARAYISLLENLMPVVLASNYVEPPNPFAKGGQGGQNNNRSGGYQRREAPQDDTSSDDIPF